MARTRSRSSVAVADSVELITCAWRTGAARCQIRVRADGLRCQWHTHWVRLVDAGHLDQQQYEAFVEWWEQFQPYGHYGDNPGPWWAAIEVLWPVLTGCGEPPVLTSEISRELQLRRAEVRHYRDGLSWSDPWPRVMSLLLPRWEAEEWQGKINAPTHNVPPLEAQRA